MHVCNFITTIKGRPGGQLPGCQPIRGTEM